MCGSALFRSDAHVCSVLSCFHLLCVSCLGPRGSGSDRASCPLCGAEVECLCADADALLFKPSEYLSHMVASAAESLAFQNAVLAKRQERSVKRPRPEPSVALAPEPALTAPVSALPRAANARLSMRGGGGPAAGGAEGPKKPKLEKIRDYLVPAAASAVPKHKMAAAAATVTPPPLQKEMPPAFRRAKPQVYEQ